MPPFEQPKGAAADVKEIEYVSALHQSGTVVRQDGTITPRDVSMYLASRHGVRVDEDYVRERIFRNGLCATLYPEEVGNEGEEGGDDDDEGEGYEDDGVKKEKKEKEEEGDEETERAILDPAELTAALLIPELIKASRREFGMDALEERGEDEFESRLEFSEYCRRREKAHSLMPPSDIVGNVLDVILEEATGSSEPRILNADLLRRILLHHGEKKLAEDDELIADMIEAAGGGVLDRKAFAQALTEDVQEQYRVEDELELTTNYYDVFGEEKSLNLANIMEKRVATKIEKLKKKPKSEEPGPSPPPADDEVRPPDDPEDPTIEVVGSTQEGETQTPGKAPSSEQTESSPTGEPTAARGGEKGDGIRMIFTYPSIDFMADTFRSGTIAVCLWAFFLCQLLAAGTLNINDFPQLVPTTIESCQEGILCSSVTIFLTWVNTVFTMTIVGGLVIVGIGSLGNSLARTSPVFSIVSLAPIIYFVVKTFTFGTKFSDLGNQLHRIYALAMTLVLAAIFFVAWSRDFASAYLVPKKWLRNRVALSRIFASGSVNLEACTKQAASYKANLMMKNAYDVTCTVDEAERRGKPLSSSIFGFMKNDREVELKGGWRWTMRSVISREIYTKEGVRISSRLIAGNAIQAIIILYMILFTVYQTEGLVDQYQNLPGTVIVTVAGGAADMMLGGLNENSSRALPLIDGAIDLFYDSFLPALSNLTVDSCNGLASFMNLTQVQSLCSAASLYSESDLLSNCALYAGQYEQLNSTVNMEMACSAVDALGSSVNLISTICSYSNGEYAYTACNLTGIDFSGLPSAESMKMLVRVALQKGFDKLISFVRNLLDPSIVYVNSMFVSQATLQPWVLKMAFGLSGLLAFVAAVIISASYYPSVVSTTLKFRSGILPSLRDPDFNRYRRSVHWVTLILGGMFWGTLFYLAAIIFCVGVLIIAIAWIAKNAYATAATDWVAAWILGTIVAYIAQAGFFTLYGTCTYKSFYRKQPAPGNAFSLLWETSWLGLSVMVVVMRLLKLVVGAVLEVGRIDKPFFAEGVGTVGGLMKLDRYPDIFRQDILSHEAHLHPYIERLGKMYLMKLRHGPAFATKTGSCWRVLFVVALMPWMRTFRMAARPELLPSRRDDADTPRTHTTAARGKYAV